MGTSPATAENLSSNLLKLPPTEITVSLGNVANELKFEPNQIYDFVFRQ